ncbi:MAG: ribose-5-phosphate isomerase RpiA [Formosimonas sp.]
MTQDQLKRMVAQKAIEYVPHGAIIGVGTGSTADLFIDELAHIKQHIQGAIASSERSKARLEAHGIRVFDVNEVESVPVYIDGADEIDPQGNMLKGGGAAHTREKICASIAEQFICICDASKQVAVLGQFPLPVEVVPLARAAVARQLVELGGAPVWRMNADGTPLVTDNGCHILDVHGLQIDEPLALEMQLTLMAGVLTVGIFAQNPADVALIASSQGVDVLNY